MGSAELLRIVDEAHARQLPALIAEWAHGPRRLLARALRIDLALLTERPELVVSCLYRRCAFDDIDLDWDAHVDRAWLRALRAPTVPVDGAVVEEYRTSIEGELWVSEDGERIGVAGEHAHIAWDRATGRRVEGARARPVAKRAPERWRLVSDNTWGRLVVERADDRIEVPLESDDQIVSDVRTLVDDLVLVSGNELEGGNFYALVDLQQRRVRWSEQQRLHSAALLDDERVIVGHNTGVQTISLASGKTIATWRCPFADNIVPLPDGNIATRTDQVIRVWNVGEAAEREQGVRPDKNSWTVAAFSPDGERVMTGHALCDGRSGVFIAHLDCNRPAGWLAGGPPLDCQRLCNGVFAEIMPFGLTLWETRDGSQLLNDRDRRAQTRDTVAFDPTGTYHAIWSDRGTLQLYRLRESTLVTELEQRIPSIEHRKFGFSADGAFLAWINADGERWALRSSGERYRLAADDDVWEPPTREASIANGLVIAGDAMLPIDDTYAIYARDGRYLAGRQSHYKLEGA